MLKLSKLAGWFKSYDRKRNQAVAAGVALTLLIASWLYPPWVHYNPHAKGQGANYPHGWFFVFDTNQGESGSQMVMSVDFERLILLDAIIVAVVGAMAWAAVRWRLSVSAVGLSILAAGVVVVTVAVAGQVVGHLIAAANKKYEQAWWEASRVPADDLKKIVVFDATYDGHGSVKGRIRNDLPRTIDRVELRASFYYSKRELIEAKYEMVFGHVLPDLAGFPPGIPGDFFTYLGLMDLPQGWSWSMEVTNAHYLQEREK